MRKIHWLITISFFFLGILVGIAGYIFWGSEIWPGVNNPEIKGNAAKVDSTKYGLPDPSIKGHDLGLGNLIESQDENSELTKIEQDKIISDYKQAVGILFDAWKARDISAFRSIIANAYTGELMESHIRKAQEYIPQGIGLYVTEVSFDDVVIESADKHSATVKAVYRYTVRDYDLDEQYPFGEEHKHFVNVRANLIKIDSRWLITGETIL